MHVCTYFMESIEAILVIFSSIISWGYVRNSTFQGKQGDEKEREREREKKRVREIYY